MNYKSKGDLSSTKKIANVAVFTGGEASSPETTFNFWKSAKKICDSTFDDSQKLNCDCEPDFAICADSGLETFRAYCNYFNYTRKVPHLILGDFDSLCDEKILSSYPEEIVKRSPCDKDFSDTELALSAAKMEFPDSFITLVGGAGGRVDHFVAIFDLFGTSLAPDAWICGEQILLNAHKRSFFVKGLGLDKPVSIARATSNYSGGEVVTRGLEWESDLFRKRGMPSLSNRISLEHLKKEIPVEFCFKRGKFVLILPVDVSFSTGRPHYNNVGSL